MKKRNKHIIEFVCIIVIGTTIMTILLSNFSFLGRAPLKREELPSFILICVIFFSIGALFNWLKSDDFTDKDK